MLAGCKGELAVVTVHLGADGSGECEVGGIRDVQVTEGDAADGKSVLENVSDVRSVDLRVQQTRAKFKSIEALKIGDISFSNVKEDGMNLLTVRIPAGAGAKWFEAFGVSQRSLQVWSRVEEESRKANESRKKADPRAPNLAFEPPKPPNVFFEVTLPAKLAGQDFETVPLGHPSKVSTSNGERQASLTIPLAEIHANSLKEIVWKIRYPAEGR
jgi:hypothetical protein